MRKFFFAMCWMVAGLLAGVGMSELVLSALPVIDGHVRSEDTKRWPLINYRPGTEYTYSRGWDFQTTQHGTVNNYGHLAPFDFVPGTPVVLVLGDSYIESKMNRYADTLQAQLAERYGGAVAVYGLGASGLSLADYLRLVEMASKTFDVVGVVIAMIDGDIQESMAVRAGWARFVRDANGSWALRYVATSRPQDSRLLSWLKGRALYRYLRRNLGVTPGQFSDLFDERAPEDSAELVRPASVSPEVLEASDYFLDHFAASAGVPPSCVAFVRDGERLSLYGVTTPRSVIDSPALVRHFTAEARERGYSVALLDDAFARFYATNKARLDYWPFDRHWNRHGHGVAAAEAFHALLGCRELAALRFGEKHAAQ
ncbi:MAG: hypothetical protein KDE46_20325 [Caldilineaceae bacterium]|nr:hypothetical protein [Caldilineaceae bacterium]